MTDYTFVAIGIGLAFVVILVLMVRMVTIIQPGQEGLVFLLGAYRRGLSSGFNMVSPLARVEKVRIGGGPNHVLGMLGEAETDLEADKELGTVKIGEARLAARSTGPVRKGARVRVLKDLDIGTVLVGGEFSYPRGPTTPSSLSEEKPLR